MKTNFSNLRKNVVTVLTAFAVCGAVGHLNAQDQGSAKGGAAQLMKQVRTLAEANALKAGDSMAMVCTKCKSVVVHNVTTEKGHIKTMTVGEKHLCPGCNSTIVVVGVGKGPGGAHDEVKHVCGKCGDTSAFCCATKPGSGATKGMDKESK